MRIECPKCHSKYEIEDSYIPIGGAPVKCPKCGNIFGIYVEPIDIPMTPILDDSNETETLGDDREFGTSSINPEYVPQEETNQGIENFGNINPDANSEQTTVSGTGSPLESAIQGNINTPSEETVQNDFASSFGTAPQETTTPDIGANPFATPTEKTTPEQSTPDLGSPFGTTPQETTTPDIGANPFAQPQEEQAPDLGSPFGTTPQETTTPDIGANPFATPTEEAKPEPVETPSPFAETTPDMGSPFGTAPQETTTPDIGANPFAETTPEPTPEPQTPETTPDNPFLQQAPVQENEPEPTKTPSPFAEPTPEPTQETQTQEQPKEVKRVGGKLFESLLAGFTLPENYKTLPPNIQKNHKNAIKLARQLAKDILLYHKDTVEQGLENGNVKELLADEIEKSYKFYQQRIQPEIIQNTNYFNEALNKIIAKGHKVF